MTGARGLRRRYRGGPVDDGSCSPRLIERGDLVAALDRAATRKVTIIAHAHRALGDRRAANTATERALALAEPDRLVLPFAMTGAAKLLESLPRHETVPAALLVAILDVLHGSSAAAGTQPPPLNAAPRP